MAAEGASLMHQRQAQHEEQLDDADFVGAEVENDPKTYTPLAKVFGDWGNYRPAGQPQKTIGYLEGLKGLIAFEAFLWVFFRTIVPGAVFESLEQNTYSPPRYQSVLREVFSPMFWDGNLQASFFVIISARLVAVRFLSNPSAESMAGTLFRRGLRLWFPTAVALAIATIINYAGGFEAITHNAEILNNHIPEVPYKIPNAWAFFNSVFNLFWYIDGTQAGVKAFPTGQLWIVPIVYQESFTVYMIMLMFPYMTRGTRFYGMLGFIVVAWWLQSWSWYGVTGLLFADGVIGMNFIEVAKKGLKVPYLKKRLSTYYAAGFFLGLGIVLKYVYEVADPNKINDELIVHTPIYGGGLNRDFDVNQPHQRISSWFMVVGALMFIEMNVLGQKIMANPLFRYLGRISFSWFLTQSCIIYTVGLQLNLRLQYIDHWAAPLAQFVTFLVCLITTIACADVFTRIVDNPSKWLADYLFDWIRR